MKVYGKIINFNFFIFAQLFTKYPPLFINIYFQWFYKLYDLKFLEMPQKKYQKLILIYFNLNFVFMIAINWFYLIYCPLYFIQVFDFS